MYIYIYIYIHKTHAHQMPPAERSGASAAGRTSALTGFQTLALVPYGLHFVVVAPVASRKTNSLDGSVTQLAWSRPSAATDYCSSQPVAMYIMNWGQDKRGFCRSAAIYHDYAISMAWLWHYYDNLWHFYENNRLSWPRLEAGGGLRHGRLQLRPEVNDNNNNNNNDSNYNTYIYIYIYNSNNCNINNTNNDDSHII